MKNVKSISLFLITLILVLLFTGCDSKSTSEVNKDIAKYLHDYIVEELENGIYPVDACFVSNGILYVETNEDITSVYLLQRDLCYVLDENGKPIKDSGGAVPMKYDVKVEGDIFTIVNIEMAESGSEYLKSLEEIFPAIALNKIKNYPDSQLQKELEKDLQRQIKEKYPDIEFE